MDVDVEEVIRGLRDQIARDTSRNRVEAADGLKENLLKLVSLRACLHLEELEEFLDGNPAVSSEARTVADFLEVDGPQVVIMVTDSVSRAEKMFSTGRRVIIVAEEDGTPVGIVAEFDVLCRAVCQKANLNAGEYRIRDILSLDAVEIGAGTNVLDALKTMLDQESLNMEVVDNSGSVLGAVYVPSILRVLAVNLGSSGSLVATSGSGSAGTSRTGSGSAGTSRTGSGSAETGHVGTSLVGTDPAEKAIAKIIAAGITGSRAAAVQSAGSKMTAAQILAAVTSAAELAARAIAIDGIAASDIIAEIAAARAASAGTVTGSDKDGNIQGGGGGNSGCAADGAGGHTLRSGMWVMASMGVAVVVALGIFVCTGYRNS